MRLPALALAAALAGCSSPDLPTLPDDPGRVGDAAGEAPVGEGAIVVAPTDPGVLTPAAEGDAILPGVILLSPSTDVSAGVATFAVRNDSGRDLPDLILSVVFAVHPAGGKGAVSPRFESVEAPLKAGETRWIRAALAALLPGETPASFRVVAGLPELLTAGGADGQPGTTFLGGLLECVSLEADLVGVHRRVTVVLAERGSPGGRAPLPPLEAQLLIGRAGDLQWTGPWILVPNAGREGAAERRIQWNLDGAPGLAACDLFLRVREKR